MNQWTLTPSSSLNNLRCPIFLEDWPGGNATERTTRQCTILKIPYMPKKRKCMEWWRINEMTGAISKLFFLKYFNWTTIMKIDWWLLKKIERSLGESKLP